MQRRLKPNFDLAIDVMTDARPTKERPNVMRLHQAITPVTVERELRLALAVARKDGKPGAPLPGEDVTVTVTAVDPQGKPVAAEIGLAMTEQALLDQFGAKPGDNAIATFFTGGRRQTAVRTASSVVFAYAPQTR